MDSRADIERVFEDWCERRGRGEEIQQSDVLEAHPELAEELARRFEALDFVDMALASTQVDSRGTPTEIGDYRIIRELGRGGMGVVFEAEQESMERPVALKVLSLAITSSPNAVKRFQREARSAGRLHHTNIVPVYAMGQHDGHWYYAMELVHGRTLGDVVREMRGANGLVDETTYASLPSMSALRDEAVEPETTQPDTAPMSATHTGDAAYYQHVARMFAGVADALHLAHMEGVIHRDVKPGNLMLTGDGVLKLLDFGLARAVDQGATMTIEGQMLGTPVYMSPEQTVASSIKIDRRTDIYSLGATLYEVLTLKRPFDGKTTEQICQQIVTQDPLAPRRVNSHIPRDLQTIVQRAMTKEREGRYASAHDFARDLERFADGAAIHAKKIGLVGHAWRKIKRHRVRSALTATALALAALAVGLAFHAVESRERAQNAEYERLIADSEDTLAQSMSSEWMAADTPGGSAGADDPTHMPIIHRASENRLADRLARAIELRPDRPEAWWLRALASGRTIEQRLSDLDAAQARGISPALCELASTHLQLAAGLLTVADMESAVAALPDPADATEAYLQAELLFWAGDTERARGLLSMAVRSAEAGNAIHWLALKTRATLHRISGRLDEALADLHAVRGLGDRGPDVAVRIARIWHRMKKKDSAEKEIDAVIDATKRRGSHEAWVALVRSTNRYGLPAWQERATRAALAAYPESDELRITLASALQRSRKREEAYEVLAPIREDSPKYARAQGLRAVLMGDDKDWEGAARILKQAIKADGTHAQYERLGLIQLELDQPEDAISSLRRARDLNLRCSRPNVGLYRAYVLLGRFEDALASIELACRLAPRNANNHLNRGTLLWNKMRRAGDALAAFDRCIELDPKEEMAHANRGVVFNQTNRPALAAPAFERALELTPDDPDYVRGLCDAIMEIGQAERAVTLMRRLLENEEQRQNARNHHCLANALMKLNRNKEALVAATEAVRLDDTSANNNYALARALCRNRQYEEGLEAAKKSISLRRPGARGLSMDYNVKAHALKGLKRWDEAIEAFRKGVAANPDDSIAAINLAEVLIDHGGKPEEGQAIFEAWLKRDDLEDLARGDILHVQAKLAVKQGEIEKAKRLYEEAIESSPGRAPFHINYGVLLISKLKNPKAARDQFAKAAEIDPDLPVAHRNLGIVSYNLRDFETTASAMKRAIELGVDQWITRYNCAQALRHLHHYEDAIPHYQRSTEHRPKFTSGYFWWAQCLLERKRWSEAEAIFDELLKIDPEDAAAHNGRGIALYEQKRYEETLDAYDAAIRYAPKEQAHVLWYARAGVLSTLGRLEDEIASYEKASQLAPKWFWPYNDRSVALMRLERYDEALAAVNKALEIEPEQLMALRNKATILMHTEDVSKALEPSTMAITLAPDDVGCMVTHAEVLWHVGHFEEAVEYFRKAAERAPGSSRLWNNQANVCFEMGTYERAEKISREAVKRFASDAFAHQQLVAAVLAQGRRDEAAKLAEKALEAMPEDTRAADLAWFAAVAGRADEARKQLAAFEDDVESAWHARRRAAVLSILADVEGLREWLTKAAERGLKYPPGGKPDPVFLDYADDPEVKRLLGEMTSPALPKK